MKREDVPEEVEAILQFNLVEDLRNKLEIAEGELASIVEQSQGDCSHSEGWEEIREYDHKYSPRIDGKGKGLNVLIGKKCLHCKLIIPRKPGSPLEVCYSCGGKMSHNRTEPFGEDRVHVHKCESCGHEHDCT